MAEYAIVFGVDEYIDRNIRNLRLAQKDARALHGWLYHRFGFGENAHLLDGQSSLKDYNRHLNDIGSRIQAGDRFVLYFAGHGHQQGDNQYLWLSGVDKDDLDDGIVEGVEMISLKGLKAKIDRWPEIESLIILDACRSAIDPLQAGDRGDGGAPFQGQEVLGRLFARDPGLRKKRLTPGNGQHQEPAVSVILNSCCNGEKAYEPADAEGGLLRLALADEFEAVLGKGETLSIDAGTPQRLIQHIEQRWGQRSPQRPWLSPGDGRFELYRSKRPAGSDPSHAPEPSATATPAGTTHIDERLWKLACLKDTAEAYEQYLEKAPADATHLEEAYERIERLLTTENERAQAEAAARAREVNRPGRVFRDADWSPEMVIIPAGDYWMGSPETEAERSEDEGPRHRVTITQPFSLGKYPVTRGEFARFIEASGYDAGEYWRNPGFKQDDRHPVVCVSWHDAQAYSRWLSQETGQQYRLPGEAEWEYACRGGTESAYWWGNDSDPSRANYDSRTETSLLGLKIKKGLYWEGTTRVDEFGGKGCNAFGLCDLHGNVREWVEDGWHGSYKGAPTNGSAWTTNCEGDGRVVRGGSWNFNPWFLRSAGY
jgi:formylglycine-generating enzyme required for sulfatase activity